jgi:hypothetical protein
MRTKVRLPELGVHSQAEEAHRQEMGDVLSFGALADLPVQGLLEYAKSDPDRLRQTEMLLAGARRVDKPGKGSETFRGLVRILEAARAKSTAEYDGALLAMVRTALESPERFRELVGKVVPK